MRKLVGRFLRLFGLGHLLAKIQTESWRWRTGSLWVPPGHYYSPIFTRINLLEEAAQLGKEVPRHLAHIALDETRLLNNLKAMDLVDRPVGFPYKPDPAWRYHAVNGSYPDNDAACLVGMARKQRPKRIIEVGCGFSSALLFDLNDREWNRSVELCFVDPDPGRMIALLREGDKPGLKLHPNRLQGFWFTFMTSFGPLNIPALGWKREGPGTKPTSSALFSCTMERGRSRCVTHGSCAFAPKPSRRRCPV